MNWINRLERKFGRYAIHNLMYYMIGLNVAGFVLSLVVPEFFYSTLLLSVSKVLQGEVWRLITFILDPPSTSLLYMFFFCMLYYLIGSSLENTWGAFRFNLYYFSGILFHILAAFIVYFVLHVDLGLNLTYLNMTLFLAAGAEFPDYQIYIMGILPVKMKWLAALDAIGLGMTIINGFVQFALMLSGSPGYSVYAMASGIAALISILNFLLYFLNSRNFKSYSPSSIKRRSEFKKKVNRGRKETNKGMKSRGRTMHKCAVCGKTEEDDENLEFRFCSKCEGSYEYCSEHLYTHKHVTGN